MERTKGVDPVFASDAHAPEVELDRERVEIVGRSLDGQTQKNVMAAVRRIDGPNGQQ